MERDAFLARIRESLAGVEPLEAPTSYRPPPAPDREQLIALLIDEHEAVGGAAYRASSLEDARRKILDILGERSVRKAIRGDTPLIRDLSLDAEFERSGVELTVADTEAVHDREALRAAAFAADAGITSVDFGVAETGTLALLAAPGQGRAVSLLPPIHVAVLNAGDIVYELAALFEKVKAQGTLPSALTFVTGPSRTGDIEQTLTVGVHGPGELHLIVIG